MLAAAAAHRGTSLVEIYQNCPIFNDGAFDAIKDRDSKDDAIIPLVHGEPIRFGVGGGKGLVRDATTGGVSVVETAELGEGAEDRLLVHDAHAADPTTAFAISRLTDAGYLHQAPDRDLPAGGAADVRRPGARPDPHRARRDRRRPRRPAGRAGPRWRHLDHRLTRPGQ